MNTQNSENNYDLIPVLILGFRRIIGVIELTSICATVGVKRIYLALDGPKTEEDQDLQKALIREFIQITRHNGIEVEILERDHNLGVAAAIISALDWFFEKERIGIILEDDVRPNLDFFSFASEALEKFEGDADIWMISGNQFFPGLNSQNHVSCTNYPLIWGWATWRDQWLLMRAGLLDAHLHPSTNRFSPIRQFLDVGKRRSLSGYVDSWALPLAQAQYSMNGLTILPPTNLSTNIGADSFAVHTAKQSWHMAHENIELPKNYVLDLGNRSEVVKLNNRLIEKFVFKIKFRHRYLFIYSHLIDFVSYIVGKKTTFLVNRLP